MKAKIEYFKSIENLEKNLKHKSENIDLILIYPSTPIVKPKLYRKVIEKIELDLKCSVVGVSTGGVTTHLQNNLDTTKGICTVLISDSNFEVSRIDDVWSVGKKELEESFSTSKNNIVFQTGSRAAAENNIKWKVAKKLSKNVIDTNLLRQRSRFIKKIHNNLESAEVGWPEPYSYLWENQEKLNNPLSFNSTDSGKYLKGFELSSEAVTDSKSAIILKTDLNFERGVAKNVEQSLKTERVVEEFETISKYKNIIYKLGNQTISELNKKYPIEAKITEGGFSYYMVLDTDKGLFGLPLSDDLGLVVSHIAFDKCEKVYLVRAPSWEEYKADTISMLDQIKGNAPHININPPQISYFGEKLEKIKELVDNRFNSYAITFNGGRRNHKPDYNFPSYVAYDSQNQ